MLRWNFTGFFLRTNKQTKKLRANRNLVAVLLVEELKFQLVWMGILTFQISTDMEKVYVLPSFRAELGQVRLQFPHLAKMKKKQAVGGVFMHFSCSPAKLGEILSHRF